MERFRSTRAAWFARERYRLRRLGRTWFWSAPDARWNPDENRCVNGCLPTETVDQDRPYIRKQQHHP
ncbi:hypothetical protein SLI_3073 [Streptomyces lividans 1326]|uniref:Uncharacterized protein n=1 Tax=Streptomyces lividans 1326 TaxID=1200984 RepID=A0A7U9HCJ0_STRLI|nr:hypothetical protein SLI_3073 [Streptomyces lividans 1326]